MLITRRLKNILFSETYFLKISKNLIASAFFFFFFFSQAETQKVINMAKQAMLLTLHNMAFNISAVGCN